MAETPTRSTSVDNDKLLAASAYILFFVPMLVARESKFAMYHANQGFNLFLLAVAIWVVGMVLTVLTFGLAAPIVMLANVLVLVLAVLGIVNALNGQQKPLPVIGNYKILKL
jgi:uncharacterized membrane protein